VGQFSGVRGPVEHDSVGDGNTQAPEVREEEVPENGKARLFSGRVFRGGAGHRCGALSRFSEAHT
jgi:hypothetical protein